MHCPLVQLQRRTVRVSTSHEIHSEHHGNGRGIFSLSIVASHRCRISVHWHGMLLRLGVIGSLSPACSEVLLLVLGSSLSLAFLNLALTRSCSKSPSTPATLDFRAGLSYKLRRKHRLTHTLCHSTPFLCLWVSLICCCCMLYDADPWDVFSVVNGVTPALFRG